MEREPIYILGAGSIGMALAAHLTNSGRTAIAVRTSSDEFESQIVGVTIHGSNASTVETGVETVSLARLARLTGIVVITAKSYANEAIAARLSGMEIFAPIVLMQNGVGIEKPYLGLDALRVYRCVLYATGQKESADHYTFRPVAASPIGVVRGDDGELDQLVDRLSTAEFPFVALANIQKEVWKKATINAVFNSICALLETDNGIFVRDERAAALAREVVDECVTVMQRMEFSVSADEVMAQLLAISRGSSGQLISTLQDINGGRETEIEQLNLEIARVAATVAPGAKTNVTRVLGEMVKLKSLLRRR